MIRHIVMWKLGGENAGDRVAAALKVKQSFESLRGAIPGLASLEIGIDFSRAAYACDVVLVSDFVDLESFARYAGHPEHLRVKMELEGLRIARHQVDYVTG